MMASGVAWSLYDVKLGRRFDGVSWVGAAEAEWGAAKAPIAAAVAPKKRRRVEIHLFGRDIGIAKLSLLANSHGDSLRLSTNASEELGGEPPPRRVTGSGSPEKSSPPHRFQPPED